jgi:poly-gamma-glutamate synthesis protein (capsule biosynthesis protein)
MASRDTLLGFVGDVFVDRDRPEEVFDQIVDELKSLDFLFGNLEGVYTSAPHFAPSAALPIYADPSNLAALPIAGFSVLSLANNHTVDCGHEALLAMRQRLEERGIAVCGAGANLEEARRPAVVEAAGRQVAVLAYTSTFPFGYEARSDWPGIAPIRTRTHFEPAFPNHWLPGELPNVRTEEFAEDLDALRTDIGTARADADIVVASFHWGDMSRPLVLTDHERRLAHIAVDAGADIVVGHHHHALRGAEWYAGRPIFYGLGHFVFDIPTLLTRAGWPSESELDPEDESDYGIAARRGWPYLPMPPQMRQTMLAWCRVRDGRPDRIGFLPCRVEEDGRVQPLQRSTPQAARVLELFRRACETQSLPVRLYASRTVTVGRYPTIVVAPTRHAASSRARRGPRD